MTLWTLPLVRAVCWEVTDSPTFLSHRVSPLPPSSSSKAPALLETLKLAKLVAAQTFWKVEELVEVQRCGGSPGTGWKHEKRGGRGVVLEG